MKETSPVVGVKPPVWQNATGPGLLPKPAMIPSFKPILPAVDMDRRPDLAMLTPAGRPNPNAAPDLDRRPNAMNLDRRQNPPSDCD